MKSSAGIVNRPRSTTALGPNGFLVKRPAESTVSLRQASQGGMPIRLADKVTEVQAYRHLSVGCV
jgi:hypothetical protein